MRIRHIAAHIFVTMLSTEQRRSQMCHHLAVAAHPTQTVGFAVMPPDKPRMHWWDERLLGVIICSC